MTAIQSTTSTTSIPTVVPSATSYDDLQYPSYPVTSSHPDRLFDIAKLFGMSPTPPENARILELGCAGGGNIIPVASLFPNSQCVGIELSETQANNGRIACKFIGLKNIEIHTASITDITKAFGKFDYIVCHGVFSWVPDFVRDAILRVASENLNENGVAYISYNVYPGWYYRGMVRELMVRHVKDIKDIPTKIAQARALLAFLVEANQSTDSAHAAALRSEAKLLANQSDMYIFHEHLEDYNKPFYFQDFIAEAAKFNLQFLGEASIASMWKGNFSPDTASKLETINDSVLSGHYMDCIIGRTFRETLLVHKDAKISRHIDDERISDIRFMGSFKVKDDVPASTEATPANMKRYKSKVGTINTCDREMQIAIEALTKACPYYLSVEELIQKIHAEYLVEGKPFAVNRTALAATFMQWALAGHMEFRYSPNRLTTKVELKPKLTSWARAQAQAGTMLTGLLHEVVTVSELHAQIIPFVDGTRDIKAIAAEIELLVQLNMLKLDPKKNANVDMTAKDFPVRLANQILGDLARVGLLVNEAA